MWFETRSYAAQRHAGQLAEIERHNQRLLQLAYESRIDFMKNLKTGSLDEFKKTFTDKFGLSTDESSEFTDYIEHLIDATSFQPGRRRNITNN